ncbi:hypothetical protein YYG_05045 [Plasmodium vinckei petteri]|uniref:PIR protein CIR protein n=1 Tax=Plasmodium vinckei petteri TaxID=138298 RepID=W7ALS1_PLAVN|nr:hypothetical protein YYG_05045 [Plasmodium vinckei petteri]
MGLSFRLFQAESYRSSTLIDFYNNHIMKSHLFYSFDNEIKKKEDLLYANLEYMNQFYLLFKEICFITLKHSPNYYNANHIKKNYTRRYNKYKRLYDDNLKQSLCMKTNRIISINLLILQF